MLRSCDLTVSHQTLASRAPSRRLPVMRTAMKAPMVSHTTIALDLLLAASAAAAPSLPALLWGLQALVARRA